MQRKVAWLFVWTTLTYWVGCGELVSRQDHSLFTTEPVIDDATPSVRGLDRSDWQPTRVGPYSGKVPHYPHYYKRQFFGGVFSLTPDRPSPLYRHAYTEEPSIIAATDDPREEIGPREIGDLFLAPSKFALDTVTLPIRAVTSSPFEWTTGDRPWFIQYSPQERSPKVQ